MTLPVMLKDNAMPNTQPTMDTMPSAMMTLDEAIKLPRYQGMWPSQAMQYAARDIAYAKMQTDGINTARTEAARDHMIERMADAWKNPGSPPAAPPTHDAAAAHGAMARDLSEAWKG